MGGKCCVRIVGLLKLIYERRVALETFSLGVAAPA